jgi:hypothetical protein
MNKSAIVAFYYFLIVVNTITSMAFLQQFSLYNVTQQRVKQQAQYIATMNQDFKSPPDEVSNRELGELQSQVQINQTNTISAGVFVGISGILVLIIWIITLVNLGRAREWGWFFGMLFAPGVVMLVYAIAGPKPLKRGAAPQLQPSSLSPQLASTPQLPSTPYSYPSASHQQSFRPLQSAPSSLEILRQRYARGEIDSATYDEIAARLQSPESPF